MMKKIDCTRFFLVFASIFLVLSVLFSPHSALAYTVKRCPHCLPTTVHSEDDVHISFNGYTQFDALHFWLPNPRVGYTTNIPRMATSVLMTLYQNWQFYARTYWLARNKLNYLQLAYVGWKDAYISVGQLSPDFGLENEMYSTQLPYMQTALPVQAWSPGYGLGTQVRWSGQHWVWAGSVMGRRIAENDHGGTPWAATMRFVFAPLYEHHDAFHVGVSWWWQKPDGTHNTSFSTVPELATASQVSLVNTGTIQSVSYNTVTDAEALWQHGSWTAQGEYLWNHVARSQANPDLSFSGYYMMLGYFLTGDTMLYHFPAAIFLSPQHFKHQYGALQLLGQVSHINLNSHNIRGGNETNANLSLVWYINRNVRLLTNMIHTWYSLPQSGGRHQGDMLGMRVQVMF